MKPPMLHTAYKVTTTRDAYGSFVASTTTILKCHVRYIINQISDNNEVIQSDLMVWFEPDSGVVLKDIVKIDGEHYRIERITKARRLRDTTVQFLKCDLLKYGVIS